MLFEKRVDFLFEFRQFISYRFEEILDSLLSIRHRVSKNLWELVFQHVLMCFDAQEIIIATLEIAWYCFFLNLRINFRFHRRELLFILWRHLHYALYCWQGFTSNLFILNINIICQWSKALFHFFFYLFFDYRLIFSQKRWQLG